MFKEINSNACSEKYNQHLREQLKNIADYKEAQRIYDENHMSITHKAEAAFKEFIWNHTEDSTKKDNSDLFNKENYLDCVCKQKIRKYSEQLEDAMRSYVIFDEVRTKELTSAYGDLNFIFSNKTIRQHIYDKLYRKQFEQVDLIKRINYHFNLYFEGKGGSKSVMLDYVWKLQNSLISEEKNSYYRQYVYDIDYEMTQVLVYANGKANKNEFPDKDIHFIRTKPDWLKRMMQ